MYYDVYSGFRNISSFFSDAFLQGFSDAFFQAFSDALLQAFSDALLQDFLMPSLRIF